VPDSATANELLTSAQEAKSRGAYVIGVGDSVHKSKEVFNWYIPIQATGLATGITQSVIFQLLAYYLTLALDNDPDKPRNLAKSVTVK
jgi:glucosamine--fructose-6-phosphate aminotransferase (isomerizing)